MFALPWFGAFWGLRRLGLVLLGVFVGLLPPLGSLRLVLWRWGLLRLDLLRLLLRQLFLLLVFRPAAPGPAAPVLAGQLLRLGLLRLVLRRLDLLWPHCLAPWKLA